jgi:hypothetical protein
MLEIVKNVDGNLYYREVKTVGFNKVYGKWIKVEERDIGNELTEK